VPRTPRLPRVLVVDDSAELAATVADGLEGRGYAARACSSSVEALQLLEAEEFDALVTDLRMPEVDGLGLLAHSRRLAPERPVLVMTAFAAIDTAIESIRRGAYHYLTKPFTVEELALFLGRALDEVAVRREARALKSVLGERFAPGQFVAESPGMRRVLEVMERVADAEAPILILGETGTGKGLVARSLHAASRRAAAPFVTLNCAAVPEALLESELFGHVRGAFTGAVGDQRGLFTEADGGTLFLDEIGEMSPALQAKLLHVLETGQVRPVGAPRERVVDVRVIAATHRDLRDQIARGAFRQDLLYRLEVVTIEIPPLRARREDLPGLIEHFFRAALAKHPGSPVRSLSPDVVRQLLEHRWPGNVRELAHLLERVVLLGRGPEAVPADLPPLVDDREQSPNRFGLPVRSIRQLQREYAAWALEQLGGQRGRTAEQLGVDGKTLARWLSETG